MTNTDNWTAVKLSEIADIGWGDLSITKKSYVEEGFTAFSATGADGLLPYFDYDENGIVVSAIGANCGKIWRAYGKWSCIKNTMRILIRDAPVTLDYLYYFLSDPNVFPKRGSGQPFISQEDARNIDVRFPPIDEQLKIVGILEDHISRLDSAMLDVKQANIKAAQFKVSFLRDVCKGNDAWKSIPLKSLGQWNGGGTPSKSNMAFWTNGTIPWLSPKDMGPNQIYGTEDLITEEAALKSTVKKVAPNSVVLVVRSGILERKLPVAITMIETTLNQDMKAITFNNTVLPRFGFYAMLGFEQDILKNCRKSGTTVASLNTDALMEYRLRIPDLATQQSIIDYVERQITLLDSTNPSIMHVENIGQSLRRSLLQAAFTGKLSNEVAIV